MNDFQPPKRSLEAKEYGLPAVVVEVVPEKPSKGTMKIERLVIKTAGGKEIGHATLNIFGASLKEGACASLNGITIIQGERGKGYGKATYLEIIKLLNGIKLKTGLQLSRGSLPVWEWLTVNGLARRTSKGEVDESRENEGYSSAEFETI